MYETTYEAIHREYDDLIIALHDGELHQSERNRISYLEEVIANLPDGGHGVEMIAEGDFVEYTKDLIHDCYELPKEFNDSNEWPWRHITFNYEAAAEDLEQDYTEVEFDGVNYHCREQ